MKIDRGEWGEAFRAARKAAGFTQASIAAPVPNGLGIPRRTVQNWECGIKAAPPWVQPLLLDRLEQIRLEKEKAAEENSDGVKNAASEKEERGVKINDYKNACLQFAEETKEWGSLDDYKLYTTDNSGWRESCDNAHGGLDVCWAFHQTPEQIAEQAPQRFVDQIAEMLAIALDDGWDAEQLAVIKKYLD